MSLQISIENGSLSPAAPQTTSKKRKSIEMEGPDLQSYASTSIELVADADVTLRVGQGDADMLEIKVSGAVLSVASKVFATMLSSSFVEGITKVIELKEDDPQIVLHACRIFHGQEGSLEVVDRKRLIQLTAFADMRCCEESLKPWIMSALDKYRAWSKAMARKPFSHHLFPSVVPDLIRRDLISIAYAFDIPDLFYESTIVRTVRGGEIGPPREDLVPNFPDIQFCDKGSFFDRLETHRTRNIQRFLEKVIDCISRRFYSRPYASAGSADQTCKAGQTKFGGLMFQLSVEGIHATKPKDCAKWWIRIVRSLQTIAAQESEAEDTCQAESGELPGDLDSTSANGRPKCSYCAYDVRAALHALIAAEEKLVARSCLRCIKEP